MIVEVIQDLDRLREFESEWEDLWLADPEADVFSSAGWFITWWEHFGGVAAPGALVLRDGARYVGIAGRPVAPFVLVAREEERAVAVLPLVRVDGQWRNFPARILASPVNSQSPRGSFLLPGSAGNASARAFLEHISSRSDWDLLALEGIPARVLASVDIVGALERCGLPVRRAEPWAHTVVRLEGSWEQYLRIQSHNFRKSLSRAERFLETLGTVRAERHAGADEAERAAEVFLEVDRESWKATRGESIASNERLREYYTAMIRMASRRGGAAIWTLHIGAEPVAATMCLHDRQWLYVLKSSFKERSGSAYLSPTFVLMKHILEDAWGRGLRGLDFLNRTPFTMRWGKDALPCHGVLVFRSGVYPGILRAWDRIRRALRPRGTPSVAE